MGLAFSPATALLASCSWDKTVRLWDVFESKGAVESLQHGAAAAPRPHGPTVPRPAPVVLLCAAHSDRALCLFITASHHLLGAYQARHRGRGKPVTKSVRSASMWGACAVGRCSARPCPCGSAGPNCGLKAAARVCRARRAGGCVPPRRQAALFRNAGWPALLLVGAGRRAAGARPSAPLGWRSRAQGRAQPLALALRMRTAAGVAHGPGALRSASAGGAGAAQALHSLPQGSEPRFRVKGPGLGEMNSGAELVLALASAGRGWWYSAAPVTPGVAGMAAARNGGCLWAGAGARRACTCMGLAGQMGVKR